jgi:hypothetical protein
MLNFKITKEDALNLLKGLREIDDDFYSDIESSNEILLTVDTPCYFVFELVIEKEDEMGKRTIVEEYKIEDYTLKHKSENIYWESDS